MSGPRNVLMVTGSRSWVDADAIREAFHEVALRYGAPDILIEGGAKGADRICRLVAQSIGIHVATVEALWTKWGSRAGPKRNHAMLVLQPTLVLAFPLPSSIGTYHAMGIAERAGIPVLDRGRSS